MDHEAKLLDILQKKTKKPPTAKKLAEKLGVKDIDLFRQFLVGLEEQGIVVPAGRRGYALPEHVNRYAGIFIQNFSGGGVVRGSCGGIDFEIFVPIERTGKARPGNRVLVELTGRKGKRNGNILRTRGLTGKIIKVYGTLDPMPVGIVTRNRYRKLNVLLIGETGKRYVMISRPPRELEAGDVVKIKTIERPYKDDAAEIVEIIGSMEDAASDADVIAMVSGIPVEIPKDAVREAEQIDPSAILEEASNRKDLRGELCVTIDPDDAKDFDDAVSCRRVKNGWRIGIHIADVSFFAPAGSALDEAAHERGTTVYLPGRVIPMLPERLANNLCSLRPDEPRLAKSVHMTISKSGEIGKVSVEHAIIRSAQRFTYDEVGAILRNEVKAPSPELGKLLRAVRACARALRARRTAEGTLFLNIPKPDITLNKDGTLSHVEPEKQDEPHWLIEEFMIAANQAVAGFLIEKNVPYIARVHPEPSPDLLPGLSDFLKERGYDTDKLPTQHQIQKVLDDVAESKGAGAIHLAVLKAMQRAEYSPRRGLHYALATDKYLHFTSPIRRYTDLHVHQTLDTILRGQYDRRYEEKLRLTLPQASLVSTRTERRAEKAEREVVNIKILRHLADRTGLECEATVSGVSEYGVYCTLDEFLIDGRISLEDIDLSSVKRDRYNLVAYTPAGRMHFAIGDRIKVVIERVDIVRREMDLAPVTRMGRTVDSKARKRASKKRRARKQGRKDQPLRTHYRGRRGRRKR
ncbi:MAG: ribonuclease R family protein [Planctomycetota bacterium]|jgi:ribonuclease R